MTVRPDIQQNVSLRGLNSLGIAATARYFVAVHDSGELTAALAWADEQQLATLVLGVAVTWCLPVIRRGW